MSGKTLLNLLRHKERNKESGNGFGIDIRRPNQKACALRTQSHGISDIVAIVDKKGRMKLNQDKSSCLTVGGHGAGNHSDMDILIIQRPRQVRQINPCTESGDKQPYQQNRVYDADGIMPSLCSAHAGHAPLVAYDEIVRRITPAEAARLQTIPDWYKWECSATQQYTMLGNGWTVEVIKHIFSFLNK